MQKCLNCRVVKGKQYERHNGLDAISNLDCYLIILSIIPTKLTFQDEHIESLAEKREN